MMNMFELSDQQLFDIAEYLDSGMRCFFHKKTGEIKTIIDPNNEYGEEEDPIRQEIEENWGDYFEFERMPSHDAYEIRVDFTETIDNEELQDKLVDALRKPKPFRHFKDQIDNSGEYRQKWFDYQKQGFIAYIKKQINDYYLALELKTGSSIL
jgi:hypothetical protein